LARLTAEDERGGEYEDGGEQVVLGDDGFSSWNGGKRGIGPVLPDENPYLSASCEYYQKTICFLLSAFCFQLRSRWSRKSRLIVTFSQLTNV
jgi:hypothetical protein